MVNLAQAQKAVIQHLEKSEREMNMFGAALKKGESRANHQLVITQVEEHEFGWVFFYNTKAYVESGDFRCQLAGNAPLIVDKADGQVYVTGTAHSLQHYLEQFRSGERQLA